MTKEESEDLRTYIHYSFKVLRADQPSTHRHESTRCGVFVEHAASRMNNILRCQISRQRCYTVATLTKDSSSHLPRRARCHKKLSILYGQMYEMASFKANFEKSLGQLRYAIDVTEVDDDESMVSFEDSISKGSRR